ncbi:MAG: right-handed parallel beta-helix repeat-containing protein, partial [Chloroflexota bacterium]
MFTLWIAKADDPNHAAAAVSQVTYEVNSTNDVTDGFCNAAHCSLREAINASNFNAGVDTILFDLPLPALILPDSELPEITERVIIDGAAFGNGRCASGTGPHSELDVTLSGAQAGTASGIILGPGSDGSTVKGLSIVNYSEFGIEVESNDNIIRCNHIGVNGDGVAGLGNGRSGVYVTGDRNRIGGDNVDDRNTISDNGGSGIFIQVGSDSNIIQNNYIGTNSQGESFPNAFSDGNLLNGISINGSNNLIGGREEVQRNVIADNGNNGIFIEDPAAEGNAISNNYIGVDVNGDAAGNGRNGIFVEEGSGTEIGNRASNFIAHNVDNGIRIGLDAFDNEILENRIQQNGELGIDLEAAGETSGTVTLNDTADSDSGANTLQNYPVILSAEVTGRVRGTISGSPGHDITVYFYTNDNCDDSGFGEGRTFRQTVDMTIDSGGITFFDVTLNSALIAGKQLTAMAFNQDIANSSEFGNCAQVSEATFVVNSTANTADAIHGDGLCDITGLSTDCTLRAAINEINGSASGGPFRIEFDIPGAGPHTITPPNDFDEIIKPVTIDGTTQEDAACATNSDLLNLLVMLDGSSMLTGSGLTLAAGSDGSEIRGLVIGGFPDAGVLVRSNSSVIACNLIGLDVSGNTSLGNGTNGVRVTGNDNRIGGTSVGERNVISANGTNGVLLGIGASGNDVKGNFIGTNSGGSAAVGNAEAGVRLNQASDNQVGGRRTEASNLISGNALYGIQIRDESDSNRIWNNQIGTNSEGTSALPNGTGILVRNSDGNEIGGPTAAHGNLIHNNTLDGVLIREDSENNPIRYNSIANNGELGIDLNGEEVTPNDAAPDGDGGGNQLQNFPEISVANPAANLISFTLISSPATDFTVDIYRSASCDPSGYGEGETHIGSGTVTTDASGAVTASLPTSNFNSGDFITATATDPQGNSSEFSSCVEAEVPDQAAEGDYGDAPDSSNNQGVANTAYAGTPAILGNFPTSYQNAV